MADTISLMTINESLNVHVHITGQLSHLSKGKKNVSLLLVIPLV